MKNLCASVLGLVVLAAIGVAAADGAKVEIFSPEGTVKQVNQVTVRFSENMVPFGDPRQSAPFEVKCSEKGSDRWVDQKNWVYEFGKELPAGVLCEFQLKPGLKSLDGKELTGQRSFKFSTGGPAIRYARPYEGSQDITEDQVFVLQLDAEPNESSVVSEAYFAVDGIQERVGVRLIMGSDRKKILKASYVGRDAAPTTILLQAKRAFPAEAKVQLVWAKGIMTKTGVPTETDQVKPYRVRKPFQAEFSCERENVDADCIPIGAMSVNFSSPIPRSDAEKASIRGADGKARKASLPKDSDGPVSYLSFPGPFPETSEFVVELPGRLKDDAGRPLSNQARFPLKVRTGGFPPLAKFSGQFGILELKGSPILPVTVRNLEADVKTKMLKLGKDGGVVEKVKQYVDDIRGRKAKVSTENLSEILYWMKRVQHAHREMSVFTGSHRQPPVQVGSRTSVSSEFKLPGRKGTRTFEVIGIPLNEPGLYVVELESTALGAALLGKPDSMYVPTMALVTNLGVHFKWGRESSLAWVTALDSGKPVAGAEVQVRDCSGTVLWRGASDANGIAVITKLPAKEAVHTCQGQHDYSALNSGLLVTATQGNDMSFVHTSWSEGIESWRFSIASESYQDPNLAHTVFARSLLRAGETLHMKHFIRRHARGGFLLIPPAEQPTTVVIEHQGTSQKYEFPLKWDAGGISETTWKIPTVAKLGTYVVSFSSAKEENNKRRHYYDGSLWRSGSFRVEEFRVPLVRATVQGPAEPLVRPKNATVELSVQYLSGGGASNLPVKVRHQIQPRGSWQFAEQEGYSYANGTVKEGQSRTDGEEDPEVPLPVEVPVSSQDITLDKSGTGRATLGNLKREPTPYQVLTEMQFNDPNGETQTVASWIPVFPARNLVGIKMDSWAGSKEDLKFYVSVVDLKGRGVSGAPVKVDILEKKTYSHRKRIVGGFYSYEHFVDIKKLGSFCEGKTDDKGRVLCQGKAPASGNLIVQATTRDSSGDESSANTEVWIAGEGQWWYQVSDNDRMDVLPEKNRYEPGENAKFQVRLPFRDATALIAVEREGVMETYVQTISGKSPFIEVPIKGNYAPNVYVSVLAVRGRVGDIQPTALVDLGRPAYKLGIGEIRVGWREHELKVRVTPEKSVYQVREKARVKVKVETASGATPAKGEIALAAVDEGLLELMDNESWKLLDHMMGRRGYAIENSTAQMQVVGRRHFGLKALPSGGGGGDQATRELFDTLLLWKGRAKLDRNGEAEIEVPLNDSITSFRIVAVANAGVGQFGTGSSVIRATQDLMMFSGVPPLVREGDKFRAQFTLRNTTDRNMVVQINAGIKPGGALGNEVVSLAAGSSQEVAWEVTAPVGANALQYDVEAIEKGGRSDRLRIQQKVVAAVPVRTFQATVTQLDQIFSLPIERPGDAIPGRGGVVVGVKPSLLSGLDGIREYMQAYPYSCLEQDVSRAVALRDKKAWQDIMERLPAFLDHHGLAKYFPLVPQGSDTLTSYVLAIADEAGWAIPQASEERMVTALQGFVLGTVVVNSAMPTTDLSIRKMMAVEALSRRGKKVVDPAWLAGITIEPNLWPTSAVLDWFLVLRRGTAIPDRDTKLAQVEKILRTRINFQGTQMSISNEKVDDLWWLMISGDRNAVRMILATVDLPAWREDMPRLVKGALGRQHRGHWDLTTANAWGVLALEKFAANFERVPVSGTTRASVGEVTSKAAWKSPAVPTQTFSLPFEWPAKRSDLVVKHEGSGKPWVVFQALAAIPLTKPLWAGYRIEKSVRPLEQKIKGKWSRGDLARVRLVLRGDADMTWVVVSDPIPGGAAVLGSGLGRDSAIAVQNEKKGGSEGNWVYPAFEERSFEAFRAYYEYVNKGEWVTEYTVRLNNVGNFSLPSTRVEAMYAPEMFAELPNSNWEVQP